MPQRVRLNSLQPIYLSLAHIKKLWKAADHTASPFTIEVKDLIEEWDYFQYDNVWW